MQPEIHLMIIWQNGRHKERQITEDLGRKFDILGLYYIKWSNDLFSQNITRFYGQNLPSSSAKIVECGIGEFVLIVFRDTHPRYNPRYTTKGVKNVNVNIFDAKELYRYWTGGGSKVHATNNTAEVNHDLTLLLGLNAEDYLSSLDMESIPHIKHEQRDLMGSNGWKNINELLYVMNNCINYVILRNYEDMPQTVTLGAHSDVDILCDNPYNTRLVICGTKVFKDKSRVRTETIVSNEKLFFDIRYVGDNYYDATWEKSILDTRVMFNNSFYVPNKTNMFYSLLYHAVIQKNLVADDYKVKLTQYGSECGHALKDIEKTTLINILSQFLTETGYRIEEPKDISVGYYSERVGIRTSTKFKAKRLRFRIINKLRKTLG